MVELPKDIWIEICKLAGRSMDDRIREHNIGRLPPKVLAVADAAFAHAMRHPISHWQDEVHLDIQTRGRACYTLFRRLNTVPDIPWETMAVFMSHRHMCGYFTILYQRLPDNTMRVLPPSALS